jgi:acetoin utilization deacetylase AcuC-like enzyme
MEVADQFCNGRVVSILEGGYDLQGLAGSVGVHLHALMHGDQGLLLSGANDDFEDEDED